MGQVVYIIGRSGTGKSYSMRNFKSDEITVINVQGKLLPFKNKLETITTDTSNTICAKLRTLSKKYKSIVIDDFQYVMANEFMRRANEKTYDKFTEIGKHAWDVINIVSELPEDVLVYIICHTDTDTDGFERIKTIGKMIDQYIVLEGLSTIVLKTHVADGVYTFLTQNNGNDTVKSPCGMFPTYAIDNDLKYVDEKIRNYYELGEFLNDDEIKEIDEIAKNVDIEKPESKKPLKKKTTKKKKADESEEKTEGDELPFNNELHSDEQNESVVIDEIPFDEVNEEEQPFQGEGPKKRKRKRRVE